MKGWVGLVGWPVADGLPTEWSPVGRRPSAGQRQFAGQRPAFRQLCYATKLTVYWWFTFLSVGQCVPPTAGVSSSETSQFLAHSAVESQHCIPQRWRQYCILHRELNICSVIYGVFVGATKRWNLFSTRLLSSCTEEYAHTYDISTYSVQQWSCELGLGFFLRAARVHTHRIYIHATCKCHVEKGLTRINTFATFAVVTRSYI